MFTSAHRYGNVYILVGVARALAVSSDMGFRGSKVHKNVRSPALDADEQPRKKIDTASFILVGAILNRKNTQTNT